jgi:hypothetical protein
LAKKFSLESVLSLVDGISSPMAKIEKNVLGYSKKIQRHLGGFGKDVMKADAAFNRAAIGAAKWGIATTSAAVAGGAAIFQMTANSADEFSKTARMIGITTEQLQALSYAGDMQGVTNESMTSSLMKLNKNMGDLRVGSGTLAAYIGKVDKGFLKTLKSTDNAEDAFRLIMEAIKNTSDEFGKAALAQAAFGRAGMDMLKLAEAGSKGIKQLTDEARAFGLISDDAANSAEVWNDELARIQTIGKGIVNRAFNLLIPKMADFAERLRVMIFNSGLVEKAMVFLSAAIEKVDVDKLIQGVVRFANGVKNAITFAVGFWKALQPYIPLILGLVIAFKALVVIMTIGNAIMAIMALNPVTLTIMAIVAGVTLLIAGFIALSEALGGADNALLFIGRSINVALLSPINAVIDAIRGLLMLISNIPGVGKIADAALSGLENFQKSMNKMLTGTEKAYDFGGAWNASKATSGQVANSYASPDTRVAESRSYSESRTTNEVFVRADRGASVSDSPGGAPRRTLSYGRSQ